MATSGLVRGVRRVTVRILIAYTLDWLVVLGTVAFAGSTSYWAKPNIRPFSPVDPNISFPFQTHAKIPTWLLVLLAVIFPGLVILVATLSLPRVAKSKPVDAWRSRLYTLNAAWLGLGVAIAAAMLITDGLKNLIGRPRPDMLSRCDVDERLLERFEYGNGPLVGWGVCRTLYVRNPQGLDESNLRDGFRSFPSGHSSMSFSGLTYLTLFLLSHTFPLPSLSRPTPASTAIFSKLPRNLILLISAIPILIAMYIASTRVSDFRHHAFDVLFGAVLGMSCAFCGWKWYGQGCVIGGEVYVEPEEVVRRDVETPPAGMVPVGVVEEQDAVGVVGQGIHAKKYVLV